MFCPYIRKIGWNIYLAGTVGWGWGGVSVLKITHSKHYEVLLWNHFYGMEIMTAVSKS